MNDIPNEKPDEPIIATIVDNKPIVTEDKRPTNFIKAYLITWVISGLVVLLAFAFIRYDGMRAYYFFFGFFGFNMQAVFFLGIGFAIYSLSGKLLKRFENQWLHHIRLALCLAPLWGFALLIAVGVFSEWTGGPESTLGYITKHTVSVNEVEDLRDNRRAGMKCKYWTASFQTTPEVVERLLKQREYQKKWPLPEENLDYFSKEEISGQLQELIKCSIGTLPENWPDPTTWDGVEVFEITEDNPHSRPGSYYRYCLITNKEHRQVILEYDDICP